MESPTPDVIMAEMDRVLQAFGAVTAGASPVPYVAPTVPVVAEGVTSSTHPESSPSLPSYNSSGLGSSEPPNVMRQDLAEPAHITTPDGLSLTAERLMPPAPRPQSIPPGRPSGPGRGIDAVVQSLFSVFAPNHLRTQPALATADPTALAPMTGGEAATALLTPEAVVALTPTAATAAGPPIPGPSLADLNPVSTGRMGGVTMATPADEEEVVEFSTLGELLEEFEEASPLVELLAAAFYLTSQSQQASYAFRELNIALMRDKRQPVPHAALEEALTEGYLRELPADDASASKPNYCLTEAGRLFLESHLV
jgi:hypothetical protein